MPPRGPVYVCLHRGTSLVSRMIRWHSRGNYSHASIVLPDGRHCESREGKGVLMHPKFTLTNPSELVDWFTVDNLTAAQVARLVAFFEAQVGKPYDWPMVFGFVSRSRIEGHESAGKWFCSEMDYAGFVDIGIHLLARTHAWEVDPDMLSRSPALRLVERNIAA